MGSAANNENSWTPYDYKDCSLGICSIYCPQFCYFIFPPPPPPSAAADGSPFSPLIIAIIGVLACAFILVSYYTVATRFCRRTRDATVESEEILQVARDQSPAANGLEEAAIKAITVCRYEKGDGLIEGSECAVCLSEFEEKEAVRLLPKCSHAFHLPCIDTWLKSHSSCPLCRAAVSPAPPSHAPPNNISNNVDSYEFERPLDLIVVVDHDQQELHSLASGGGGGGGVEYNVERRKEREEEEGVSCHLRRSVSLGRLPSTAPPHHQHHVMVEMGEMDEDLGRNRIMRCKSSNGISSSKGFSVEVVRSWRGSRGSDLPS